MAGRGGSCSIFIGNMPYDAVEEELKELFSKAGQVNAVRIVSDKDTKQPKGYAFCDFVDSSSVQIAIDKMNNVEYNGRKLRVDGAERELSVSLRGGDGPDGDRGDFGKGGGGKGGGKGPPRGGGPPAPGDPPLALPPPMPTIQERMALLREQGATEKAKIEAADQAERAEVARLMETLTPMHLLHLLGQMQRLTLSAPDVARALVGENIQLALALQHTEFLVGLLEDPALPTDPEVKERAKNVREILWKGASPIMPTRPQLGGPQVVGAVIPPFGSPAGFVNRGSQPGVPTALGPGMAQVVQPTVMPQQNFRAVPYQARPAAMGGFVPVAAPAPGPAGLVGADAALAGAGGGAGGGPDEHKRALLERLVQLSPTQIDQLPHDQKVQLLDFLQTLPPTA